MENNKSNIPIENASSDDNTPKRKRGLPLALRIPLWIVGIIVGIIILLPVMLYIPPVQDFIVSVASDIVKKETGMDVEIERMRLKFPLDVSLQGVRVIEASGDTMVMAREAIADVKLLPLLGLDVKLNRLSLHEGFYRMVSPDSSMIMRIRAGLLEVEPPANVNIKNSEIALDKAKLKDGDISLYMNVWKQTPSPTDSASTPFLIKAKALDIERMRFAMSMLPTIDTLVIDAKRLNLREGVINLRTNQIGARSLTLDGGEARYIAPTPEYVAAHPLPPTDSTAVASAPMTITADSIAIKNFGALYALKGATPIAGFDPNYIEVKDVNISLHDFFNRQASLRLPITSISARERSGLQITAGHGLIALTEAGISIEGVELTTPFSSLSATADLPFALMALQPEAPVNLILSGRLGMNDVASFMPMTLQYIKALPSSPLNFKVTAEGTLADVEVSAFDLAIPRFFSLRASGHARNALDFKRLVANLAIDGEVVNPAPITKIVGEMPVVLPPFRIKGKASANYENYAADLSLHTPQGSVIADGRVGMNSMEYYADLSVNNLNVAHFMPDLGIGNVTASLKARGAGFNPTLPRAHTEIDARINNIVYEGNSLRDITLKGSLAEQDFVIDLDSPNKDLNIMSHLTGSLRPDDYCVEGIVKVYNADLQSLGLSETPNGGSADLHIDVTAHPERWLYDTNIECSAIDWMMGENEIYLPDGVNLTFIAESDNVHANIDARGTNLTFDSTDGLQRIVDGLSKTMEVVTAQIEKRDLDVEEMQALLPQFTLRGRLQGNSILNTFLQGSDLAVDTVALNLSNDSLIRGDIYAGRLTSGTMTFDTIGFNLEERGKLLDYKAHIGNKAGTLDEFAQVNLNGYIGSNRLSAFLTQRNIQGKMGYRFGFTGAIADSTLSVHFTPLKATIAYMPWSFNDENHVDINLVNRKVDADLMASSRESSILLRTEPSVLGGDELHMNLTNIHIEDFLNMSLFAPPIKADVDADLRVHYDGATLRGKGDVKVENFIYDRMMVGNFDLGLLAGVNLAGESAISGSLKINNEPAVTLSTILAQQDGALEPKTVDLELTEFPLKIANAFLGKDVASLSGSLNGKMNMTGQMTAPVLNGAINCHDVAVFLPIMGSSLKFDSESLMVEDNILKFDQFDIYGANNNPLTIHGSVDARQFSDIQFDLSARANNFQLINNDRRAKSDIYGKLFMNLTANVTGPMRNFDVNADLNILGNSDVTYNLMLGANSPLTTLGAGGEVVKFVNFSDTTQVVKADSVPQAMAMRITAGVNITPGVLVTVNIDGSASGMGSGKVQLSPSGSLNYFQNFMGDMTLNGQLFLGSGSARYKIPVMGEKTFTFDPQSYLLFNGDIMNPTLNISATDAVKATVVNSSGNSNQVNFLVKLNVTNNLANPKVVFDLSTNDDLSLENELQSMSADQRSTQAMNLLITGNYQGSGMKTSNSGMAENMLYGFLTSTLNNWAANNIRGVDLSFGIDQYDKTTDGQSTTAMSYSYQVSKSLFSNRFKIVVGGNYSTDASADENFAQNLISDVSFEYTLKQTNTLTMLVRLFRHLGYESILEGEITETGVGFTMRRRLSDLRRIFKVNWGKRKSPSLLHLTLPADSSSDSDNEIREIRDARINSDSVITPKSSMTDEKK